MLSKEFKLAMMVKSAINYSDEHVENAHWRTAMVKRGKHIGHSNAVLMAYISIYFWGDALSLSDAHTNASYFKIKLRKFLAEYSTRLESS
jgi:hypothetical protein